MWALNRMRCGRPFRLLWAALGGAMGAMYLVGVAIQTSAFVGYYCEEECDLLHWEQPHLITNADILNHLRTSVIEPQLVEVPDPPTERELVKPSWEMLGDWDVVQEAILNMFWLTSGGVFVEVGAGGGVVLSYTAFLEARRNWTGLLLEPNAEAFAQLRSRRKASAARACASDIDYHKQDLLWTPNAPDDLDPLYREISRAKSSLLENVAKEDRDAGTVQAVQCFSLRNLIWASLGRHVQVDLMVIHTSGGEYKILSTLENTNITVVLLVIRTATEVEKAFARENARALGFIPYTNISPIVTDFLFFINQRVDLFQAKKDAS